MDNINKAVTITMLSYEFCKDTVTDFRFEVLHSSENLRCHLLGYDAV